MQIVLAQTDFNVHINPLALNSLHLVTSFSFIIHLFFLFKLAGHDVGELLYVNISIYTDIHRYL